MTEYAMLTAGFEAQIAALAVQVVNVVVPGEGPRVAAALEAAVAERAGAGGCRLVTFEVQQTTKGFVGGQSRAVLELLSGRENLPVTSRQPEAVSGLRGK